MALQRSNDLYRAAIAYTGAENRLNRAAQQNLMPADVQKYDHLVQELAAGVVMARWCGDGSSEPACYAVEGESGAGSLLAT